MDKIIEQEAKIFKALGHPSRLKIVKYLENGEQCVCELVKLIGADFSTVSKHLTILKNAGIVQDEKKGKMVFYSLCVPCILKSLECLEKILDFK